MTPLRLRLFHAADGTRVAYREAGVGPGARAAALAGLSHREFEPVVEHLDPPLPRRAARPAAARRLRGPPAPPVHARLVRRGDGRRSASRRPGRGRSSAGHGARRRGAAARRRRPGSCAPGGSCSCPTACTARRSTAARRDLARARRPRGRRCRARPRARARREARRPPGARRAALGPRQPRRARPRPPRVRRRRRQPRTSRARGRALARAWPGGAAARRCSTRYGRLDMPVLLLWADEDARHPLRDGRGGARPAPRRAAARAARGPASSSPTTTRSASRARSCRSAANWRASDTATEETPRHGDHRAALGRRDHQGGRQLPRLRGADPGVGGPLAGPHQGRGRARERRARACSTATSPSASPPRATRSPPASTTTSSRSTSSRPARARPRT